MREPLTYALMMSTILKFGGASFTGAVAGKPQAKRRFSTIDDPYDVWVWKIGRERDTLERHINLHDPEAPVLLAGYTVDDPAEPQEESRQRRISRAALTVRKLENGSLAVTLPDGSELVAERRESGNYWVAPDHHMAQTEKGARKHLARRACGIR